MTKTEFTNKWTEALDVYQKEADTALEAWFIAKKDGDMETKHKMAENNAYWLAKWVLVKEMLDDLEQLEEQLEDDCNEDCDHCQFRRRVPGDIDRIDREPRYYCSRFEEV